jgi:predicted anti-sigma-YlaC factor YlaD
MNCREIKRKLSAYQDRELPGLQMDEIKKHLNNCADCSTAFQQIKEVWESLSNVETIESAPYFWTRLAQRIKERDRKQLSWNFIFAPVQKLSFPVLITCLLIFGLVIGMYLGQNIYQHSQLASTSAVEQEIDQVFPMGSFDDFPEQSVAQAYVAMLSENNQ